MYMYRDFRVAKRQKKSTSVCVGDTVTVCDIKTKMIARGLIISTVEDIARYLYIYVYLYVYIYTNTYIYIYIYIYLRYIYIHTYIHIYIYIYIYRNKKDCEQNPNYEYKESYLIQLERPELGKFRYMCVNIKNMHKYMHI
jgi:hypothetical protein